MVFRQNENIHVFSTADGSDMCRGGTAHGRGFTSRLAARMETVDGRSSSLDFFTFFSVEIVHSGALLNITSITSGCKIS